MFRPGVLPRRRPVRARSDRGIFVFPNVGMAGLIAPAFRGYEFGVFFQVFDKGSRRDAESCGGFFPVG